MKKRIYSLLLALLFVPFLPAQNTDVMIQGFNWVSWSNTGGWYNVVKNNAGDLAASGIDMIWMPPPSNAASNEGYLPRELYDVNTPYGTQAQLQSCINTLHANGVKALADIVINHRVGSSNWADFQNPTWGCWAVTRQDEWGQNGGNPCGNWDTGENYSAARDIDHTNATVRTDLTNWMNWLKNTIGFDGWRYDYVRGFSGYYNGLYNDATSPYFSVGELWDNLDLNNVNAHRQQIIDWIDDTNAKSSAFDFTTKGVLQQAVQGELWRLNISGGAPGVIGWYPSRAVTFLDNHDTGSTQAYWPFPGDKIMQGYAYILTHPGVPCVFWDHFYDWGLHDDIKDIIQIRKNNGIHNTSSLDIKVAQGNLYAAEIDGKVAMKIGSGNWSPSGSGWTLRASGSNYAVWDKGSGNNCQTSMKVRFKKPSNWANATIFFWNPTPSGPSTSWPGEQMQSIGNGWYEYELPCATCSNVIFSNNGASQTADLSRCGDGWYNGSWHSSNPDVNSGTLTIHFRPTNYSNPEIYFWGVTPSGQSTTWPGVGMSSEGNGWYQYTFQNANCANFIFSNNGSSQSPDLNSCQEVWYTEGDWNSPSTKTQHSSITKKEFAIYPQPADQWVRFRLEGEQNDIRIFDVHGRMIRQVAANGSEAQISSSEFKDGCYFYRVQSESGSHSGKFIVLH